MEEQSRSMAYVRANLKDLLLEEVRTSTAYSQELLQRKITTQISQGISEGLSATWRKLTEELSVFRERLQNDLKETRRAITCGPLNPIDHLARYHPSVPAIPGSANLIENAGHAHYLETTKTNCDTSSQSVSKGIAPLEVNPTSKDAQEIRKGIDQMKLELETLKAELAGRFVRQTSLDRI